MNNTDVTQIDIYDFDKTLVPFDSGSLFCVYAMAHNLKTLKYLPKMISAVIKYFRKKSDLTRMKSVIFSFVRDIDVQKTVNDFWNRYDKYVFDWAKKENRPRFSVVISAGPDFLIKEIASRIEIDDFIATEHDGNGAIIGKNCHDEEKVRLFRERYPDSQVENVYSDSIENDKYIFSLGKNCYHTVKGKKIPFEFDNVYKNDKF